MALLGITIRYLLLGTLSVVVTTASALARPTIELTPAEQKWLRDNPVWRIASPQKTPFGWKDTEGNWQGLNEEFFRLFKNRLGVRVEHVQTSSWSEDLPSLQKNDCDAVFLTTLSPPAAPPLQLSSEILRLPVAVVTPEHNTSIQSFEDLDGKTVSVLQGRATHEKLQRDHSEILLKPEQDPVAALGETDAFVGDLATVRYVLEKSKLPNLRIVTYAPYSIPLRIAIRSDWTQASSLINKVLASMTPQERLAIREKWITPANDSFSARQMLRIIVPVVFITSIILLVASNWRLKNAVAQRTEELREALDRLANQNAFLDIEVARRTREIEVIKDATILALAGVAETRDTDTGSHLRRTQLYVRTLAEAARQLPKYSPGLTDEIISILYKTSPLHDIGKVGIPDSILLKPGKLTKEEFEIMKGHVALGGKAIEAAERQIGTSNSFMHYAHEIVMTHHEKWDGSGYPAGLKGEKIPIAGRIMAVADVYDALRTKRVYKDAISHEEAVKVILDGRGTHFDPGLVDVFMEIHENFRGICDEYSDPV